MALLKPHWTDQEIKRLKTLSMNYSAKQISKIIGRSKQSIQIKAIREGIKFQNDNTTTALGRRAEKYANELLAGSKLLTEEDYHAPYDLDWKGKRVNAKSAILQFNKFANYPYWVFRTKQAWTNCDLFLFLGYLKDGEYPEKCWLVPSSLCKSSAVAMSRVCKKSKYTPYEIKGELN